MWHEWNEFPVEGAQIDSALAVAAIDSTNGISTLCGASYAADRGRWEDYEQILTRAQATAQRVLADGDSAQSGVLEWFIRAARGYVQVKNGQAESMAAFEELRRENLFNWPEFFGDMYVGLDSLETAIRHYRSDWTDPVVRLKLARAYERMGEKDKARDAYLYFVESWADADPELQPIVERAKQDIVRLRGDYSP